MEATLGWEQIPDELAYRADISASSSRLDDYVAWNKGHANEPNWHKNLPDKFKKTKKP